VVFQVRETGISERTKSGEKSSKYGKSAGFSTNLALSVLAGEEGFELSLKLLSGQ